MDGKKERIEGSVEPFTYSSPRSAQSDTRRWPFFVCCPHSCVSLEKAARINWKVGCKQASDELTQLCLRTLQGEGFKIIFQTRRLKIRRLKKRMKKMKTFCYLRSSEGGRKVQFFACEKRINHSRSMTFGPLTLSTSIAVCIVSFVYEKSLLAF